MRYKKYLVSLLIGLLGLLFLAFSSALANQFVQDELPPTPLPNPLSDPLPNVLNNPVTVWRPALYDIPLALGPYDHFYFTRPIAANTVSWPNPTYLYGSAFYGVNTPHTGIDIVTPEGTPVMAAADGQVIWTGLGLFTGYYDPDDPYGVAVVIQHDFGYKGEQLYTVYAHLKESNVVRGQYVKASDIIALSGRTGLTTAPHLHFEIRLGINDFSNTLNPELWLAPPLSHGIITGKISTTWGNYMNDYNIQIVNLDTNQEWWRVSYGAWKNINSDPYYEENFVFSGLPAGKYLLSIPFENWRYEKVLYIHPGGITYFNFNGGFGYGSDTPFIEIPTNLPIPENQGE